MALGFVKDKKIEGEDDIEVCCPQGFRRNMIENGRVLDYLVKSVLVSARIHKCCWIMCA